MFRVMSERQSGNHCEIMQVEWCAPPLATDGPTKQRGYLVLGDGVMGIVLHSAGLASRLGPSAGTLGLA